MSYCTTGGTGKEFRTNKLPPTRRVQEKSKGDTTCLTTSPKPSRWHSSWLSKACTTRKDSESEWLAKDNPETNPITIKPETMSHAAEQFPWVPLTYCSLPRPPFPIKSLALSAHVSPWKIHFWVLDKSPISGPRRGLLPATWPVIIVVNSSFSRLVPILHHYILCICVLSRVQRSKITCLCQIFRRHIWIW